MAQQQQVFVLDVADGPAFAFEAESAGAAEALIQARWFVRALGDFCARRTMDRDRLVLRARAATQAEAFLYWDRAAEFAEESGQILLAPISEP
jgi:hypothetical protein